MSSPQQPVTFQPTAGPVVTRDTSARAVSPKVHWAAAASALATIIWTVVGTLAPSAFTATSIASLTGATATVLAFAGGFVAKDDLR
ncbi:MAG: hypothetical protein LC799_30840, partial [Actinobacteria bacterium]|nr:hypothetical protein [Actinomycetota bacterium]